MAMIAKRIHEEHEETRRRPLPDAFVDEAVVCAVEEEERDERE